MTHLHIRLCGKVKREGAPRIQHESWAEKLERKFYNTRDLPTSQSIKTHNKKHYQTNTYYNSNRQISQHNKTLNKIS